jgi:hypothetical protein
MTTCQRCGKEFRDYAQCPYCGEISEVQKIQNIFEKITCPYCNVKLSLTPTNNSVKHIKEAIKNNTLKLICPNCLAHLKIITMSENELKCSAIDVITYQFHTKSNDLLTYDEPQPPADFRNAFKNLLNQMISNSPQRQSILNFVSSVGVFVSNDASLSGFPTNLTLLQDRTTKLILSTLRTYYREYPMYITTTLLQCGLSYWLNDLSTTCANCEMLIPIDKKDNCPICKYSPNKMQNVISESPCTILKIRYAKGELTKAQLEEMMAVLKKFE